MFYIQFYDMRFEVISELEISAASSLYYLDQNPSATFSRISSYHETHTTFFQRKLMLIDLIHLDISGELNYLQFCLFIIIQST